MKKIKYIIGVSAMAFSLVVVSCKSPKPLENNTIKNIPASFSNTKDSTNSATINWKKYFTDANLVTLIDISLKNNMDMSMALQRIEAARAGLRLSKNAMLPSVNANVSFLQRKFGYYTMDDAGNRTTEIEPGKIVPTHLPDYFVGLQTSWEIDVFGKLRNKKKAAAARFLASVEGKNVVVTNLIADLANAYYELLALDSELDIIMETILLQENALELIKAQKEAGVVNEIAVQQFQAQVANSKAMEFEVRQEITESENTINFLMGRYPQPIARNKTELNNMLPFNPTTGIPSDLLQNRPDIRQAEFELMASHLDVKAAKAAFYPSLNINGSIGFQAYKAAFLFTDPQSLAYSLFGGLMAPLINRNAIKAEFKTANATQQESLFNYQKSILNGYLEVYNEMARIKNLDSIVSFKTEQATALTKSIETSSELFKTGRATYVEVLMIQKGSLESKLELIDVKKRQYNAVVDIYKALGGGWR
ncbi:MAG: TolC family protein [Bacteroidota bacterium]|nr:TolC family protein [Bacteroidota bacterium]